MRPCPLRGVALLLAGITATAIAADRTDEAEGYALTLAWAPQRCAETGDRLDNRTLCAGERRYGFIVLTLAPQRTAGREPPAECRTVPPLSPELVDRYLPMTPSETLLQQAWRRHGACVGLEPEAWLNLAESLYVDLSIPEAWREPAAETRTTDTAALVGEFVAANPGLPAEAVRRACRYQSGYRKAAPGEPRVRRWLEEVRICYGHDGKPRACASGGPAAPGGCGRGPVSVRGTGP